MDNVDSTLGDRNEKYNDGQGHTENCSLAYRLRELYRLHRGHPQTDLMRSHDHCIEMVLGKIARIATGRFVEDNYHDIQGYIRLAMTDNLLMQNQVSPTTATPPPPILCNKAHPVNVEGPGCNLSLGHRGWHNWPMGAYNANPR